MTIPEASAPWSVGNLKQLRETDCYGVTANAIAAIARSAVFLAVGVLTILGLVMRCSAFCRRTILPARIAGQRT